MSYTEIDEIEEAESEYRKSQPPCTDTKCQFYGEDQGCMTSGPCVWEVE